MRRIALLALLLLPAACDTGRGEAAPPAALAPADTPPAPAGALSAWARNPEEGVTLRPDAVLTVETGPHTVLWPAAGPALAPPYTVRATMRKLSGRIHEGYGIVFGGEGLDAPEAEQRYAYFLVRGDGSFLVKVRDGEATPIVRDWTRHPRIHRETGGAPRPNTLEVRVGADTTVFVVNGEEVDRHPTAALPARGRAGLRVAHDVVLEVEAFSAGAAGEPAP